MSDTRLILDAALRAMNGSNTFLIYSTAREARRTWERWRLTGNTPPEPNDRRNNIVRYDGSWIRFVALDDHDQSKGVEVAKIFMPSVYEQPGQHRDLIDRWF